MLRAMLRTMLCGYPPPPLAPFRGTFGARPASEVELCDVEEHEDDGPEDKSKGGTRSLRGFVVCKGLVD